MRQPRELSVGISPLARSRDLRDIRPSWRNVPVSERGTAGREGSRAACGRQRPGAHAGRGFVSAGRSIGIDFGTTNSALAVRDGAAMTLARFHLDLEPTDTFRSVLFFPGDRQPIAAGPRAIGLYLEEHAEGQFAGRLIQ